MLVGFLYALWYGFAYDLYDIGGWWDLSLFVVLYLLLLDLYFLDCWFLLGGLESVGNNSPLL